MSRQATCSAIISFTQKLEETSSEFYEEMAKKYPDDKETFLAFAKESRKNRVLITRTYQETITDALEACFIQVDLNDGLAETALKQDLDYFDALKVAIGLEEKVSEFYADVAERSTSLLATIPRAFSKVAERRRERKYKLKELAKALK